MYLNILYSLYMILIPINLHQKIQVMLHFRSVHLHFFPLQESNKNNNLMTLSNVTTRFNASAQNILIIGAKISILIPDT